MSQIVYDAENGSNGSTLTTSNQKDTSGAVAVAAVSKGANSTARFSTAAAMSGTLGYEYAAASGEASFSRYQGNAANTTFAYAWAITLPAAQPNNSGTPVQVGLASFRYASGVVGRLYWRTDGKLQFVDSANTTASGPISSAAVAGGTRLRIEPRFVGGSTTAGQVVVDVFNYDSGALLFTFSASNQNLTTNPIAAADIGWTGSEAVARGSMYVDAVRLEDGRTTAFGPYAPPSDPAPVASTNTPTIYVATGTNFTASMSATDNVGVTGYAWTVDTKPTGATLALGSPSGASTTQQAATPGTYVLHGTASDANGGVSNPVTVTVKVYDPVRARVATTATNPSGWTSLGGSTPAAELNDTTANDATTGIAMPDNPGTTQTAFYDLDPIGPGAVHVEVELDVTAATPARTVTVALVTGTASSYTAVCAVRTYTNLTTSILTDAWDLTSSELSAFTAAQRQSVGLVVTEA